MSAGAVLASSAGFFFRVEGFFDCRASVGSFLARGAFLPNFFASAAAFLAATISLISQTNPLSRHRTPFSRLSPTCIKISITLKDKLKDKLEDKQNLVFPETW